MVKRGRQKQQSGEAGYTLVDIALAVAFVAIASAALFASMRSLYMMSKLTRSVKDAERVASVAQLQAFAVYSGRTPAMANVAAQFGSQTGFTNFSSPSVYGAKTQYGSRIVLQPGQPDRYLAVGADLPGEMVADSPLATGSGSTASIPVVLDRGVAAEAYYARKRLYLK